MCTCMFTCMYAMCLPNLAWPTLMADPSCEGWPRQTSVYLQFVLEIDCRLQVVGVKENWQSWAMPSLSLACMMRTCHFVAINCLFAHDSLSLSGYTFYLLWCIQLSFICASPNQISTWLHNAPINAKPHSPPPGERWGFATEGWQKMHPQGQNFRIIPHNPPYHSLGLYPGEEQLMTLLNS